MASRKRKTPLRDPSTYEVGHCKAPVKDRFPPGRSGNYKGRPKGSRNKPRIMDADHQPVLQAIIDEINRPVMVREGDKVREVPGPVAIVGALKMNALKGSRLAQQKLIDMSLELEAREHTKRVEEFYAAIEYKQTAAARVDQHRQQNLPEPDILPHPDDVLVDVANLSAMIAGPVTREEKAQLEHLLNRRDSWREYLQNCKDEYRNALNVSDKAFWQEAWQGAMDTFDFFNDRLEGRYKIELGYLERHWDMVEQALLPADEPEAGGLASSDEDGDNAGVEPAIPMVPEPAVKADWADCLAARDQAQKTVSASAKSYAKRSEPEWREQFRSVHAFNRAEYDRLNDMLPDHLKAELVDRWLDAPTSSL